MQLVKHPGDNRIDSMGREHVRVFPTRSVYYMDPFLLLDHFAIEKPMGFPDHPHRGFEIITYVLHGVLAHEDSAGHASAIQTLGVQKVTAGKGIVHSEMPGTDGIDSGLQLWINLPRAEKGVDPEYQEFLPNELPVTASEGVKIRHIAGGSSPVRVRRPMVYQDVELSAGIEHPLQVPPGHQAFMYVLSGSGWLGTDRLPAATGDLFQWTPADEAAAIPVFSDRGLRLAFAAGEPVGERPVFNGPFVD
ncbi:pirin family protein [Alicyclobacillus tolerans]|uniref:pirin family protein n=1 Tax=Alicyclobacillus tolerans TaxID=90970 RepID=UPI001F16855F|nr:pirin family protein [Alicyclobacillus tolerans]MCF8564251.1 pirin family protein [Alicyclobacillus tolerans]